MRIGKEPFRDIYIYTHTHIRKRQLRENLLIRKNNPILIKLYLLFFSIFYRPLGDELRQGEYDSGDFGHEIFSEDSNRLLQTIEETSNRHQVYSQPLDDINAWHARTHACTQYERERERERERESNDCRREM